ncbi:MAG TPA: tRNA preQ1(34) S-adenosylmethionine ribosyltransferase-isomerase QueA [Vicinamibacterales bacterium]|nr:tRNA preQ1(34) S-adenosylmethionine ribosyltransferase-isomerase QueA [Vicinamibacterales bacterium]
MRLGYFDYELPDDRIAQSPRPRGTSRLLVVDRAAGAWKEGTIRDLPRLLRRGDLMVANDTRVFPARLLGRRDPSGGAVECLLLEPFSRSPGGQLVGIRPTVSRSSPVLHDVDVRTALERVRDTEWLALVHPGHKLKVGVRMVFEDPSRAPGVAIRAEVLERLYFGRRRLRLTVDSGPESGAGIDRAIDALGHIPLPPYIRRPDSPDDRERYQTIFARARGSVAAPTAGLHFDQEVLESLQAAGIDWTTLTLHVGYGTFKPVRTEDVTQHQVDAERFEIPAATADAIERARAAGRRVVAVGTTTTRALEGPAGENGVPVAGRGATELFIRPGHRFRVVDAMLTNFHLPRSSLFVLVCAFAGRDLMLAAYRDAIARGFLFYSYGDAMLIGDDLN